MGVELRTDQGYYLYVQDFPNSLNTNKRILVSRNRPLALVVGAAGFLGSHLVEKLLSHNIQVIGIDNLKTGSRKNIEKVFTDKDFHFFDLAVEDQDLHDIHLPRLDYAFFIADNEDPAQLLSQGLHNFLEFIDKTRNNFEKNISSDKPRVVLTSSVDLYQQKLSHFERLLKNAEIRFAQYVKSHKLNGRIVRLATVYGARMHFRVDDPVVNLIRLSLQGKLNEESNSTQFSTRSLYVEDAVKLLVKSALVSGTAHKIYDGALENPISISEIRQILLDPLWYEQKGYKLTELPPWMTPNLKKTMKELSWHPQTSLITGLRETVLYFKENEIDLPEEEDKRFPVSGWSFKGFGGEKETRVASEIEEDADFGNIRATEREEPKKKGFLNRGRIFKFLALALIMYGLIYPAVSLGVGALSIRSYLKGAKVAVEEGNFEKAEGELRKAQGALNSSQEVINSFGILKRVGFLSADIDKTSEILKLADEGIDGALHATTGSSALFRTTKIISGEETGDPKPLYEKAQGELTTASNKLEKVRAQISDNEFNSRYPEFLKTRILDLSSKLDLFSNVVEKAKAASFIMPELTAVNGKKSYLILFQNNLELRPTGGFIGSYGKIDFEGGKLKNIAVDDIYNLDGRLADVIEPPADLKSDLGINRLYLRDSNFEPDFPTAARQAEFFFRKESGETVQGVIAVDLAASAKLLGAVGGIDLSEYGEHIDASNLFERAITHAEVNFFPGSQAKKNYLTALQANLFNKIFYLSKQNWPSIISAVGEGLEQKHIQVYLDDPKLFSYLTSVNWAGVMPRATATVEGENSDFLAIVESNNGANKVNYYLNRDYHLESSVGKEGEINHNLRITYTNNSPSEVFPAGKYKNRFKLYLPLGAKIDKATFGEMDILTKFTTFSEYGRAGYSTLLEINPKETKTISLEYSLAKPLSYKDNRASYKLEVIKQAGTEKDPFEWKMSYPINVKPDNLPADAWSDTQEITIKTDMQKDRLFMLNFIKN